MTHPVIVASGQFSTVDLYQTFLRLLFKRFRFFAFVMVAVAIYALYSLVYAKQQFDWTVSNILGLAFPFLIAPYAFFVVPYFAAKRHLQNPLYKGVSSWSFSEDGIETASLHSAAHFDWAGIAEARETPATLFLYSSKLVGYAVPRRFFSSDQDLATVRTLIRQHVAKHKLQDD